MDPKKYLILRIVQNPNVEPKDITSDVVSIFDISEKSQYRVKYKSGREYSYGYSDIGCYIFVDTVTISYMKLTTSKNTVLDNIHLVEEFLERQTQERMYRITFANGRQKNYASDEVSIARTASSFDTFRYLRGVCDAIRPEESEFEDYLISQFDAIDSMNLDDMALRSFINPSEYTPAKYELPDTIIYPFGVNISQMTAVENALSNQVSVIEGPPGTGKTQTILTIAANLIMQNKAILIVSPNNSATDNVSDKLKAAGFGFLVARLGSRLNIEGDQQRGIPGFLDSQTGRYPDELASFSSSPQDTAQSKRIVSESTDRLRVILESQLEQRTSLSLLDELRNQSKYFSQEHPEVSPPNQRRLVGRDKAFEIYKHIHELVDNNDKKTHTKKLSLVKRLRFWLLDGVGDWSFFKQPLGVIEASLLALVFESSIRSLSERIEFLEAYLAENKLAEQLSALESHSKILFRNHLYSIYGEKSSRPVFENVWEANAEAFRAEYPIVTSTVDAALRQTGREKQLFDYVIIDESSQATVVKGALALASAKNAVIVGDTKQLPPVITLEETEKVEVFTKASGFHLDDYSYSKNSLMSSIVSLIENGKLKAPKQLLKEHYRSNPRIIGFCNEKYYGGELVLMTENHQDVKDVLKVIYSEGQKLDRSGDYNRRQADDLAIELKELSKSYKLDSIGVVTPYKRQVNGMMGEKRFQEIATNDGITIATTHAYQGREKDAIAFLTVRDNITSFLDNPNLINVAVSRAKKRLVVFASDALFNSGDNSTNNITELIRYIEFWQGEMKKSIVSSIYDVLSSVERRDAALEKLDSDLLSREPSEQLTEMVLREILHKHDMAGSIDYLSNYSLRSLFTSELATTQSEEMFMSHGAHVDFIVYRKMDKKPLFGIEVNGASHYNNATQQERDKLKASIFDKAGILLCILPTHGSFEYEKIEKALFDSLVQANGAETSQRSPEPVALLGEADYAEWVASSSG
jgi:hypothetical protein